MPRSRLPLILALAVVAVALGGFLVYQQFLAGDDVARLTLPPAASRADEPPPRARVRAPAMVRRREPPRQPISPERGTSPTAASSATGSASSSAESRR